jgi:pilus assembly protein Flp/PilA
MKLQEFVHDESGAAALEVGLIAAGIAVAMITLAGQMSDDGKVAFERLRDWLRSFNLQAMN